MIKDKFSTKKPLLSFEVFPPKKEGDFESVYQTLDELKKLNPDFISVTYGAGGSKSKKTAEIASYIQNTLSLDALAHMTCVGNKKEDILEVCRQLQEANVSHVLALRGARPATMTDEQYEAREFMYASELIQFLKTSTDFSIAGACYPEKHFEAFSKETDFKNLKEKTDLGCDFLITQLFFDNDYFYEFREKCLSKNITVPICTGIMPITSAKQLGTTVSLSGSSIPKALSDIIAKYGESTEDMRKAGIDFAIRQVIDLKENGVDGIHLYTMNKSLNATEIALAAQL